MNSVDWEYESEGGKHALFRFVGLDSDRLSGHLLRIDKASLVMAQSCIGKNLCGPDPVDPSSYTDIHVIPALSPFVDRFEILSLEWSFLDDLYNRTIARNMVPTRRRRDWEIQHTSLSPSFAYATLMKDYRLFRTPKPPVPSLTIEIKPKAGYRAFSPLIRPDMRFKLLHSRHKLMGCMKNPQLGKPLYNPVDLFSERRECIGRALQALFRDPRDNFRIWEGRNHVRKTEDIEKLVLGTSKGKLGSIDALLDLVADVMAKEDFLPILLDLQRLDILDADGAIIVFERLVAHCGGSEELAVTLLNNVPGKCMGAKFQHTPLSASSIKSPRITKHLSQLCETISNFQSILEASLPDLPDETATDCARVEAVKIVSMLSKEECVYLLQNWLLSLAMCDVTFFLQLRFSTSSELKDMRQSIGYRGCLKYNDLWSVLYEIKVVDIDQKPASKLLARQEKEQKLLSFITGRASI